MHWSKSNSKLKKFWTSAGSLGHDRESAHAVLGVESIKSLTCTMGEALNRLMKANKPSESGNENSHAATRTTALAVLDEDERRKLYPSQNAFERGEAVRAIAPWARDEDFPFSDAEIALTVMRAERMGLDVLNPHEVWIWKDKHGIHFQIAYVLMAQWANQTLKGHTQPRYTVLSDEEKTELGISPGDPAVRCQFVMKGDIPVIGQMMEAGWDPAEARQALTIVGIGTAKSKDYADDYFAPNARSKMWKVKKRAYIDALRMRFGEPGPGEIRKLRGREMPQAGDWEVALDELPESAAPATHERLAKMRAREREREPLPEEKVEKGRQLLRGTPEDQEGI